MEGARPVGGSLPRFAGPLRGAGGAWPARRIGVAALAAVTMHAALLAIRPGALASSYVAPSAPVMAVRMLAVPIEAPAVPALPDAFSPPAAQTAPMTRAIEPPRVAEPRVADPRVPEPRADEPRAIDSRLADARVVDRRDTAPRSQEAAATARAAQPPPSDATPREARPVDEPAAAAPAVKEPKAADPPLPAAPDYAFGVRLDPGPRPIGAIEPEYPDVVRLREGVVVLRLLISDTGHVDDVGVVRSEPRGVFEQAAVVAFSKARFSPGLAAGTPVKSQITVEVQFMPINRGARVSGRTY